MPFQKVEYEFPDESEDSNEIEVESSSAIEIDISGKTSSRTQRTAK
jgi:hypothetical protein